MGLFVNNYPVIEAVTATTKYLDRYDDGKVFTNRGGTDVTWYLPPVADVQAGWNVWFFIVADGTIIIQAPADSMVLFNDATATSLTFSEATEITGNAARVWFDGTSYLLQLFMAAEATTTIVT
jgi:hypothetical protein